MTSMTTGSGRPKRTLASIPVEIRGRNEGKDDPRELVGEKIWERQPRESSRPFEAWTLYRDLGGSRTTKAVAQHYGIGKRLVERWYVRWRWLDRSVAYDRWLDSQKADEAVKKARALGEQHAKIAGQHMATLLAPVIELAKRMNAKSLDLAKLSDEALVRLVQRNGPVMKQMAELERLSVGLPTTQSAVTDPNGLPPPPTTTVQISVVDAMRKMLAGKGQDQE